MQFYLSSYKIGNQAEKLQSLITEHNNKAIYISNALDAAPNQEKKKENDAEDIAQLQQLGFVVQHVDLQDYFGKTDELQEILQTCRLLWISGGNVFVLRKAMQLSGFDQILNELLEKSIVYGGYSAAACVLSPSLKGYHIVDNANDTPYDDKEVCWDGLNLIPYSVAPHFASDHPESEGIQQEINYYRKHNMPYKTLHDGEVIIFE